MSDAEREACPECGSRDDFQPDHFTDNPVYSNERCWECGWENPPRDRDTGFVVEAGFIKRFEIRDWYRERGHDDFADWLRALEDGSYRGSITVVDRGASCGLGWAVPDPDPLPEPSITRHRTGTCFEIESTAMREACVDPIGALLDTDHVIHEVRHQRTGYHTDLVYADVDPAGVRRRDDFLLSRDPLHDPLQRFKVWWWVYENAPIHQSEAIGNGLYSNPATNEEHVTWLLNHGYLARTTAGVLEAHHPPRIAEYHAVELKLTDWRTALDQAERANQTTANASFPPRRRDRWGYADYRWVALDAGGIRPALENADAFRDAGVGLIAVAEGGTAVKHIDAAHDPRRRPTRDRAWVASETWSAIDVDEYRDRADELDEPATTGEPGKQVGLALYGDPGGVTADGGDHA